MLLGLGGAKDEHFSCFHSSCQLGLKRKTLILFATTLLRFMDGLWMAQLHTNKSLINIQNDLKDAQTSKRATFVTIMC